MGKIIKWMVIFLAVIIILDNPEKAKTICMGVYEWVLYGVDVIKNGPTNG